MKVCSDVVATQRHEIGAGHQHELPLRQLADSGRSNEPDPLPGPSFGAAISMLTLATTIGAALLPAVFASTREPIRELRVA